MGDALPRSTPETFGETDGRIPEKAEPTSAAPDPIGFHDRRMMLETNLARQIEAIRASDAKIVLLVPTMTAMVGVLAALIRGQAAAHAPVLYLGLCSVPILVAYFFMALTLVPRMRHDDRPSLLYFRAISRLDAQVYRARLADLTPEAYLDDLAEQCHSTAGIARTKYRHVRNAYLAFFVALPFWAFAVYLIGPGA